jgi:cation transport ATPase
MPTRKGEGTAILKIQGMDNSGRAEQLRRAADKLDGVLRIDINYIHDTATIKYDADRLTLGQVRSIHRDVPDSNPPYVIVEQRGTSSKGPARTKYNQGKRTKGDISWTSRWRGRYGRTQRGRLGE